MEEPALNEEVTPLFAQDPKDDLSTVGALYHKGKRFIIRGKPHVRMMLRRIFDATKDQGDEISVPDTLDNAETLLWFHQRYPLRSDNGAMDKLEELAAKGVERRRKGEEVMRMTEVPPTRTLLPLREYQTQGVHLLAAQNRLLVGDDFGLGKTVQAAGAMASGAMPAIVVCQTHLQKQWKEEVEKFVFGARVHIAKTGRPYDLPAHNVFIVPYSKLAGWKDAVENYGYKMIVFDEAQELRHEGSNKSIAAQMIAKKIKVCLGLTATPIYNYGDEIFSVLNVISPGCLGTRYEFNKEWCQWSGKHHLVKDPSALGSYLAGQFLFLRRRRHEVGRELPPIHKIVQTIDHNPKVFEDSKRQALQLAKTVLDGSFLEKGKAALELVSMVRQQTGIAKAPFVAEFVADMVRSGEPVVLWSWHRECYSVFMTLFAEMGIKAVLYTGSESPRQKDEAVKLFVDGDKNGEKADVFIMSLRSGAGLNRLQERASVGVFGELDWSPQVIDQCAGRLRRDGQEDRVTLIYLVSEGGSDPIVANVLGIKAGQSDGIINPNEGDKDPIGQQADVARAGEIARAVLAKYHGK